VAGGCATTSPYQLGQRAERAQDYDRAVVEYTKAVRDKPDDRNAHLALDRARLRAGQEHFFRGRRLAATERYEDALIELQVASELNPTSGEVDAALREVRIKVRAKLAASREGKTELQSLIERARALAPPGLDLPTDVKLPDSLLFTNASSRMVFMALARFANLSVVFDPAFRDQPITVDLRKNSLEDALTSLTASTHTFYRVTAQRTITIVPDTPAKRREYEESVVRTFYLSNADVKEVIDLLRVVVDVRQISPITATNAISLKDTPERIAAAAQLISAIDKARPEVVIDVELLEVNRTKLSEYGMQFVSVGSAGINGSVQLPSDLTVETLTNLTQSDVLLAGFPALAYRLLKNDLSTRVLANPHIRTSDGLSGQARFGERVPVPTTVFAPIAAGGVNQQPITSFAYENIGVNIDITPRTHHDDDLTLALKVSVTSQTGTGFGGLPTFGKKRSPIPNTRARLKNGRAAALAARAGVRAAERSCKRNE
jgi:general secretion pathway protein D